MEIRIKNKKLMKKIIILIDVGMKWPWMGEWGDCVLLFAIEIKNKKLIEEIVIPIKIGMK